MLNNFSKYFCIFIAFNWSRELYQHFWQLLFAYNVPDFICPFFFCLEGVVLPDFLPLFPHFFILARFSRPLADIPFSPALPSIAFKSPDENEVAFSRTPLGTKQNPMEQNGSLGANQLLPSSPPCWTLTEHLRVGFDCKQTTVRTTSLVFISQLCALPLQISWGQVLL